MITKRNLIVAALACTFMLVGNARAARLLSFVDQQHGWVVGFNSDVYHTKDGGIKWEKQSTPTRRSLHSVYFIDPQHGWAVGDRGTVLQTSDGGKQWRLSASVTRADLLDVFFADASHGWAVGEVSTFLKTTDGGVTWQVSQIDEPLAGPLTGVSFAPSLDPEFNGGVNFGLVVSAGGGIFRTLDGGKTWRVRRFPTANPLHGVVAVNALAWSGVDWFNFAAGPDGTFVRCHYKDFSPAILDGQPDINALDFIDDKVGWIVGKAGCIRKTNDGSKTWDSQNVRPFNLQAIKCIDSNHAWALSEPIEGRSRILFMTTDGGATWNERLVPSGQASEGITPDIPATGPDEPFRVFIPEEDAVTNAYILPDRAVLTSESSDQMSISACAGEYEPATFAIRSSVALTNVHVQAADLYKVGEPGTVISANAVDVKWVKRWYQTPGSSYTPNNVLTPELLLNNDTLVSVGSISTLPDTVTIALADSATLQPLDMGASFTKQVWLTVHVPDGAGAGEYVGEITVTADGQPTRTLELRVTVLPFVLEEPMLEYGMYAMSEMDRPDGGLYGRLVTRTYEQVEALMTDLKAHGVTYPFLQQPITLLPAAGWGPVVPWQQVRYDPTCLRKYLEILDNLGFPKDKLYWGNSYMMRHINYSKREKVGDPNLKKWPPEAFMPTVNIVTGLAKEFGYSEVYFSGMDEVSKTQLQFQRTLFEMMRKATTPVPAKSFAAAGVPSDVHDATHVSMFPSAADIAAYQASGREVTIYANPLANPTQAYTFRRNVGLLLYKSGVNGTGWYADYSEYADATFVYYTADGQLDTLQWEGWREGVDDVRYLATLQKQIEKFKTTDDPAIRQTVAKAKAWLQNFKISQDAQQVRQEATAHIMALNTTSQR